MERRKIRLLVVIAVLGVAAAVLGLLALNVDLKGESARFLAFVREEGALTFFMAMAVLPFFGFPLSPFIFSAGPVFAPTLGAGWVIVYGLAAIIFNVTVAYWVADRALRPLFERLCKWLGYAVPKLPDGRSLEMTLILRVVPGVPFFVQSYLLGLARVRFGIYLPVSAGIIGLHLTVAVLAGDALVQGNARKLAVAGVLFALVGLGMHILRKRLSAKRAERTAQAGISERLR